MAITNQDGLIAALATGQAINWQKSGQRTPTTGVWHTTFDLAGGQGAGVLAGTDTASGVVPTSSTAGCPPINAFTGSNTGYLAGVQFGSTAAGRLRLCDMLFKAGPYAYNVSAATLASQPSYSGRVPGGVDFRGTEIWIEAVTTFTGSGQTVTITYTNQDGTAGKSTGAFVTGVVSAIGRMIQVPLASGDTGVQKIESVTSTGPSGGTFNVLVLRPLWTARITSTNHGGVYGPEQTDLPILFATSALIVQTAPDAAVMGINELRLSVING
jgi:hypothetical protein